MAAATTRLRTETLEPRQLLAAAPLQITEFMASNGNTLADGDGNFPDWVEVHNPTSEAVDLSGWFLSDDPNQIDKWSFPAVPQSVLEPGAFLVVFASGQSISDYVDPSGNLHTNFKLSAGGEYLGLIADDPLAGMTVVHEYTPEYPPQFEDISYGIGTSNTSVPLVESGAWARVFVPTDNAVDASWTEPAFDDTLWPVGPTGVGYEESPQNYVSLIATPLPLDTVTAYVRLHFNVDDASALDSLTLRMKYDDGFLAYLNGDPLPVAQANAPSNPNYASVATANHRDLDAIQFVDFDLTTQLGLLQDGTNVLAIHALNQANNSDMLILPELTATLPLSDSQVLTFLASSTPGTENNGGLQSPGPAIKQVTENPPAVPDGDDLIVTAVVTEVAAPIDSVTLHYRVMHDADIAVTMVDDGSRSDTLAGDGVFTAVIPHLASNVGQMVRWYVVASDTENTTSRVPAFLDSTGSSQSPEYFGTVVVDPSVVSNLPVLQTFLAPGTEAAADTTIGTRMSLFYAGEFYDNVFIRRRGGSTSGLPKKSYKYDFNKGQDFRFDPNQGRVTEINLNTTWTDTTYLRQSLAFETYDRSGVPGSESFVVRVDRNAQFYSVSAFVEQPNQDLLKREGLDPDGALYKNVGNTLHNPGSVSGLEKKTRTNEGFNDVLDLINNINSLSGAALANYVFDNINVPEVLSYLAATVLTQNNDSMKKNFYLYRDSDGTGEWSVLPWDLDLTFGRHFMNGGNQSENIWANIDYLATGGTTINPSHPFVGPEQLPGNRSWNGLIDALFEVPQFQEMFRRRLRTVMDELLQPASTPIDERFFESRIDQIAGEIGDDAVLDVDRWGQFSGASPLPQAIDGLKTDYLNLRRTHLFETHLLDNVASYPYLNSFSAELPAAQIDNPQIAFGTVEFNPDSGNQDQEYLELINSQSLSVDISGWKLTGGVSHKFPPGTVIAPGQTLHLTPDAAAFRNRTTGPRGGQGLFVQAWKAGHLSSFGETIDLVAANDAPVASLTYLGDPSPTQRALRISEINYHPYQALPEFGDTNVDDSQFEFVELINASGVEVLDLEHVQFVEGIEFTFTAGSSLLPGQRLLLVRDQLAFESRYGTRLNIAGVFQNGTALSNGGERLKLEDANGSTILDFEYRDDGDWPTRPDGNGATLEPIDLGFGIAASSIYDRPHNWHGSNEFHGTPGSEGSGPVHDVIIHEVRSHNQNGLPDTIELHNVSDSTIDLSGWHLSNNGTDLLRYTFAAGVTIPTGEFLVRDEHQLGFALDGQLGDDVWLVQGDPGLGGKPIRFADQQDFGATEGPTTLGRWPNADSTGTLFPMAFPTLSSPNSGPLFGDLLITEIHYHPNPGPHSEQAHLGQDELEFVELFNNRSHTLNISNWRIDGLDFTFPVASQLAAAEVILVVTFDPIAEPDKAAAFRNLLDVAASVRLFGTGSGRLDNAGERLTVLKPEDGVSLATGEILVDTVRYDEASPWPAAADGTGASLTRMARSDFAPWVSSWNAEPPTPGSVAFVDLLPGDYDRNGLVNPSDHALWNAWFGAQAMPAGNNNLPAADGNSNGIVDAADFTVWRDHLGQSLANAVGVADPEVRDALRDGPVEFESLSSHAEKRRSRQQRLPARPQRVPRSHLATETAFESLADSFHQGRGTRLPTPMRIRAPQPDALRNSNVSELVYSEIWKPVG